MADVLNRTTKQLLLSVNTPDYPRSDWIVDPDLSAVAGFASKYWIITGDVVTLMDQAARDAVDAAEAASNLAQRRAEAEAAPDDQGPMGIQVRALIALLNKRDNFLTTRIIELQNALLAAKASTGVVQNLRDALPASFSPTATRPRSDAIQDYKDDIAAGNQDA